MNSTLSLHAATGNINEYKVEIKSGGNLSNAKYYNRANEHYQLTRVSNGASQLLSSAMPPGQAGSSGQARPGTMPGNPTVCAAMAAQLARKRHGIEGANTDSSTKHANAQSPVGNAACGHHSGAYTSVSAALATLTSHKRLYNAEKKENVFEPL
ncbi:hypothetical protein ABK905_06000 [Acerihabitans sp. KWT182]|uniref:Uncharacterized protein n=1 Tax=Acerihabitans sp. KWT182 TaxID=3157919 RepID=A0AAU7QCI6_9GAMM